LDFEFLILDFKNLARTASKEGKLSNAYRPRLKRGA
jgi:hypothetical protein